MCNIRRYSTGRTLGRDIYLQWRGIPVRERNDAQLDQIAAKRHQRQIVQIVVAKIVKRRTTKKRQLIAITGLVDVDGRLVVCNVLVSAVSSTSEQIHIVLSHIGFHSHTKWLQGGVRGPLWTIRARRTQLRGHIRPRTRHARHRTIRRSIQTARENIQRTVA